MTPICQSLKPGVSYGAACTLTGVQSGQKSGRGRIQGLRSRLLLSGLPAWLGLHGKLKEVSQICKMSCPKLWGAARQGLPSHGGKMQLFYTILIRQPSPPSLNTLQSRYFEMQFLANSPCMNLGARFQTSYWHIGGDTSAVIENCLQFACLKVCLWESTTFQPIAFCLYATVFLQIACYILANYEALTNLQTNLLANCLVSSLYFFFSGNIFIWHLS